MKNISGSISYAKFKFSVAGTQIKFGHRIDGWPKSPAPNQFVTSAINYHSAWTLTTYFEASISIVKKNLYLFSKQNLSQFLKIKCFPKKKFFLRTI